MREALLVEGDGLAQHTDIGAPGVIRHACGLLPFMGLAPQALSLLLMVGSQLIAAVNQRGIGLPFPLRQLFLNALQVALDPLTTPECTAELGDRLRRTPLTRQVFAQHAALAIFHPELSAFTPQLFDILLQLRPQQLLCLLALRFSANGGGMGPAQALEAALVRLMALGELFEHQANL